MTARLTPQREASIPVGHRSAVKGAIANTLAEHRGSANVATLIADAVAEALVELGYAELTAVRAERDEAQRQLAEYEPLNPQQCPAGKHTDWLVDSEYTHACPWCQIDGLKEEAAFAERCTLPDLRRAVDHHKGGKERWRTRAREAEAMVYELKRPAIEQSRNEIRSSMIALAGEASADRDHEGAAAIQIDLEKYEAKWRREDEEMQARIGTPTKAEEARS